MKSWRVSTRVHETVQNMSSALDVVKSLGSEVQGGAAGAFVLREGKCVEGGGGYLLRDGVRLFLGQMSKEVERAEAAVPIERSFGAVLGELFSAEWLASVVSCVRKRMNVDGARVFDGDAQLVIVKSAFLSA